MQKSNLKRAEEIQDLLISKGFTWSSHEQAKEKVLEEIDELFQEINAPQIDRDRLEDEFGDCLFSLINLACRLDLDSEKCLGIAISKFEKRINHVEDQAKENGLTLQDVDLGQMLKWWKEAKN
ncbi:MazG nucleotide pyrophosphohydrolase domain-containing protein [Acinetobacter nosocomialis]|uniref:MazG nucleotide pyrophosphohydrolase domain-containing protein n=1 Tax=Acinetobacter nosocomialis TaxID=106654 RepID=UPI00237E0FD1|nr:MazG nucleotide pyrophosphohydrolase domain-containing protein [Acinetobacter nosocomialis]MDE3320967.1 MazG nucleotide pyrophosphohydrolase domain-containing protein [Acinetobacter nosocomialis]